MVNTNEIEPIATASIALLILIAYIREGRSDAKESVVFHNHVRKPPDIVLCATYSWVNGFEAFSLLPDDFLHRVISGALDAGVELKDRLRVFIPWRDKLVYELWARLALDNEAMRRLGANDVYQLLPIVMEMCLPVPMAP